MRISAQSSGQPDRPVHRLFEERARRSPGALAVRSGDLSLTYRELNAQAEQLARHLQRRGVGPEGLVGLLLERSVELVVAAIAVLKAGGAYLPVDPAHPSGRVLYILKDSGAGVLVTTTRELRRFPETAAWRPLLLDALPEEGGAPPAVEVDLDGLAYVIYTSGSTGAPKGSELHHRGLSNIAAWQRAHYALAPGERMSMVAAPGFDASVWEMWATLTAGASLHLPPHDVVLSPPEFLPWAARHGVTVAFLPTPLAEAVLEQPVPPGLRLRILQTAGDRLLRRPSPDLPFCLSNVYGPTEATIVSTSAWVSAQGERPPHIGRAITNVATHVLDRDQFPVGVGVEGELCLAGVGLARGYRHRPDLTAERFLPDPFSTAGGERLYRTGDLVRSLPSGDLEFVGRLDHQVKIRGQRVEPGEIEVALVSHPAVREAAVLVREPERRLVACVALRREEAVSIEELRQFLAGRLPDVMIPSGWVLLGSLPLTPNGKVDRQALARLEPLMVGQPAMAPRTPVESVVAGIFADLLGVESVGACDDFFALGGHSLLAARVAARVVRAFGADPGVGGVFEHPTVDGLAAWIETRQGGEREPLPLDGVEAVGPAPLSFAQRRLWFLERLRPETAVYNLAQVSDLRGKLSVPALGAALDAVLLRQRALRTVFARGGDGEPVQVVSPPSPRPLVVIDLGALPARAQDIEERRITKGEVRRPYDLALGPLLRAALLRLGPEEHRFVLGLHHIVSDGWSMTVLMRELSALYHAARAGEPDPLPPLPVQYPDYAVWQRRRLAGALLGERLAWWRAHLAEAPTILDLPADVARSAVPSERGTRLRLMLGSGLEEALAALGRRHGATLFMALFAAFQSLVHRWTGQEDLILGTPVAGRDRIELEGLIGLFVNLLPVRADLSCDPSFAQLLGRVRETVLGAFSNDLPFERLVEELDPRREAGRLPLVQLAFALQDAPCAPDLGLESSSATELDTGTSRLDFVLLVERGPRGLDAIAELALDLLDEPTAQRMLRGFRTLLAGAVVEPFRSLAELSLLDAEESGQALWDWHRTTDAVPDRPVHRLFEEWAARAPEALALVSGDLALTYGELDRKAGRLARRLRRLGLGPEGLAALLLERSPDLVVAALAVLKAGGAYLPIDPAHPPERVLYVLGDAGAHILLTTERALERLPEAGLPRVVLLDVAQVAQDEEGEPFVVETEPEGLAYVIYTSGSTGAPKGTELCHRGLSGLAGWYGVGLVPGDRLPVVAAPGFDASVLEMWPALAAGATLHLPPREVVLSPAGFAAWAAEQRITVAFLPTSLAEGFLGQPMPPGLALRRLYTGGDRLLRRPSVDLPFELVNLYGPTESTVVATAAAVAQEGDRPPPIGRPIANVRACVLDRGSNPVPSGVAGELCLGGEGLARGYRRRPELTAERFVPDPWSRRNGERLYRTGDLVRRSPSGDLEFLGRIDHQVKIRGQRVELGEIEAALARHPAVREGVVLLRGPEPCLTACVALRAEVGVGELRELLSRSLPEVMVPSTWVLLDSLPLTPNGKVDRKALARIEPVAESRTGSPGSVPPRTPTEAAVAGVVAGLLGLDYVGALDDFFALGGHSLLAVRLADQVGQRLGAEVPLRLVFEAPTVAGLACRIDAGLGQSVAGIEPTPGLAGRDAPLSFGQRRLWLVDRLHPGLPAYNIPFVLRFEGRLRPAALAAALDEAARRHDSLRTTLPVPAGSPEPVQRVHPPEEVPLPLVDLAALPCEARDAEDGRLARAESRRLFRLGVGPLWRTTLIRLTPDAHRLLVDLHHAVADGLSVSVLQREIADLYRAFAAGRPSPLAALPVRYTDFTRWQHRWGVGGELERQLAWWRRRLESPPILKLPADRPRPAVWSYRGAEETAALPSRLREHLESAGQRCGATLFMTLLAAFLALLHRITGQRDLAVGSPVAGRTRQTEGLVGFFVNSLVLRVDLGGSPLFPALLSRVREVALDAFSHQDLPFERLVAELVTERDLAHNPLFQAVFALQDEAEPLDLGPDLRMQPGPGAHPGTAKFDLSLHASRSPRSPRSPGGLGLWVEYSTDLFDRVTVRRMLGCFRNLLEGIREHGERLPISDLPLLSAAEIGQVVREWNDTATDFPRASTVHGLFEEQVRRRPDAVAVVWKDEELTYAELDRRADRVASHLLAAGLPPDGAVGLCAGRSPDLIAALLGVLKAGGSYVPLDPQYPRERLATMLEDAAVRFLLLQDDLGDGFLPDAGAPRLSLDRAVATQAPGSVRPAAVDPAQLAYVVFTSGSTGRPKGVAVSHRSVVRLVRATSYCELGAGETLFQLAPVAFDASTFEIWGALLNGGTLAIHPPGPIDPRALGRELARGRVTTLWLTAGLFHQMVESSLESLAPLRQLLAGGDVLSPEHVRRALAALPGTTLINGYGPTEGTTFTCCRRLRTGEGEGFGSSVPIGRPISNTRVYILDEDRQPVPIGVAGHLHAGGEGLARCYAGRPDLTAERFVPDPVSGEEGARLYATGDRARWLPGGEVEFLGRSDRQVKVRGHRIEPGEVEAALTLHPDLESSTVVVRADGAGDKRLVAYVVPRPGRMPEPAVLRRFLESRLPAYMIPSVLMVLSALPLDPNGKVDRRALPEPVLAQPDGGADFVPPRTPLENEVARVWREVLGVDLVGVFDSFWELGGHSLLATRALSRLADGFGVEIPLQTLFRSPTLGGFTESLGQTVLKAQGAGLESALAELEDLSEAEVRALLATGAGGYEEAP